ncbi:hypothetical protein J2X68_000461 [Streptomyces sp. 3330]|nr:hypothetical protein [Streptomyces sp. 3330]
MAIDPTGTTVPGSPADDSPGSPAPDAPGRAGGRPGLRPPPT